MHVPRLADLKRLRVLRACYYYIVHFYDFNNLFNEDNNYNQSSLRSGKHLSFFVFFLVLLAELSQN